VPRESEHLSEDEIALLSAGEPIAPEDRERAIAHMSRCPHCYANYVEGVQQLGNQLLDLDVVSPPEEWKRAAGNIVSGSATKGRRRGPGLRSVAGLLLAAASVAVFLVWRGGSPAEPPLGFGVLPETWEAARIALARESASGLVYPDFEAHANDDVAAYRSGNGSSPALRESVRALAPSTEAEFEDPRVVANYAAALLASHRWNSAESLLSESLSSFPEHRRLRHLAAIAAYQGSKLDVAEAYLSELWERNSSAGVGLNLAIVQRELGRSGRADALLRQLSTEEGPVAGRAKLLLSEPGAGDG